jgi:hypothetical protein
MVAFEPAQHLQRAVGAVVLDEQDLDGAHRLRQERSQGLGKLRGGVVARDDHRHARLRSGPVAQGAARGQPDEERSSQKPAHDAGDDPELGHPQMGTSQPQVIPEVEERQGKHEDHDDREPAPPDERVNRSRCGPLITVGQAIINGTEGCRFGPIEELRRRRIPRSAYLDELQSRVPPPPGPFGRPQPGVSVVGDERLIPGRGESAGSQADLANRSRHVGPTEAVRRRLGDEGERWALAAVLRPLLEANVSTRRRAIDELLEILVKRFSGPPVEAARPHAEAARSADIDEEEPTDALTEFLYVARRGDAFGFDMLGWMSPSEQGAPRAMCLEVKSSLAGEFHLSAGEWETARDFTETGAGSRYAVLVVRRSKTGGAPERLDLLVDPVMLCDEGLLWRREDGYVMTYRSE